VTAFAEKAKVEAIFGEAQRYWVVPQAWSAMLKQRAWGLEAVAALEVVVREEWWVLSMSAEADWAQAVSAEPQPEVQEKLRYRGVEDGPAQVELAGVVVQLMLVWQEPRESLKLVLPPVFEAAAAAASVAVVTAAEAEVVGALAAEAVAPAAPAVVVVAFGVLGDGVAAESSGSVLAGVVAQAPVRSEWAGKAAPIWGLQRRMLPYAVSQRRPEVSLHLAVGWWRASVAVAELGWDGLG
jgi:hypothetical protein